MIAHGGGSMKLREFALILVLFSGFVRAHAVSCDFSAYKTVDGVKAEAKGDAVVLSWQGEGGQ